MKRSEETEPRWEPSGFGRCLKRLRMGSESGNGALCPSDCHGPRAGQDIQTVVERLRDLGYVAGVDLYREFEDDTTLPHEPQRFFDAIVIVLDLCRHEGQHLLMELCCRLLEVEMGRELSTFLLQGRSRTPEQG